MNEIVSLLMEDLDPSLITVNLIFVFVVIFWLLLIRYVKGMSFDTPSTRFLNVYEYLPKDEIHSLYQVGYLILAALFLVNVIFLYDTIFSNDPIPSYLDMIISLGVMYIIYEKDSKKNIFLAFCLFPFNSIIFLLVGEYYTVWTTLFLHILAYLYCVYFFFKRFFEYTKNNNLGLTILLLFALLFISLFITIYSEGVSIIDAVVMISNAFTSNGYTILGGTRIGKVDSLILVWGGYILSGVGTATLTAAILSRYFSRNNNQFENKIETLEKQNNGLEEKIDKLEEQNKGLENKLDKILKYYED